MASMDAFSFAAIFIMGLMTSAHCIGMCGPIVLAYSSAKLKDAAKPAQIFAHLFYSLGRVTSYAIIGFALGLLGQKIAVNPTGKAVLNIILAIFLILIAVSILFKLGFVAKLESGVFAKSAFYRKTFAALFKSQNPASFYGIGFLNGFLPCGMVYAAAGMSLAAGNAAISALAMAIFGIATAPSLFAMGFFSSALVNYREIFHKAAAIIVLVFAAVMIVRAAGVAL